MPLVIDASVACKWFVIEDGTTPAMALLNADNILLAPDLIIAETCSVVWKKVRTHQMAHEQALAAIRTLPGFFDEVAPCQPLGSRALEMAFTLDHAVYDCFYLALAEDRKTQMVTADLRLLAKLSDTQWAGLAKPL